MNLEPNEISIHKRDLHETAWIGKVVRYNGANYVIVRENGIGPFGHYILRLADSKSSGPIAPPARPLASDDDESLPVAAAVADAVILGTGNCGEELAVPPSFVQGMKEADEGKTVDLDTALNEPPPDDKVPDVVPTPVDEPEPIVLENPDPPAAPDPAPDPTPDPAPDTGGFDSSSPTESDVNEILQGMDREKLEKSLLTSLLTVHCTPKEKAAWVQAAKGEKLGNWVRAVLNKVSGFSQ